MADAPNPPDEIINKTVDDLVDAATVVTGSPRRILLSRLTKVYLKSTIAGAVNFIPALAILTSGQGQTISQEPVKRPDEHIASTSQNETVTLEEVLESALSAASGNTAVPLSGNLITSDTGEMRPRVVRGRLQQLEGCVQPTPLIPLDSASEDNTRKHL